MDKVSVIIPTWNREKTLPRAIKSVLNQTFPVYEILVCDDGSDDNSKKIISELNNPKIKWLDCGRNGMPSVPRNIGIKMAGGDLIAFLDSDDEWLPGKIEKQLQRMTKDFSPACCSNAFRIFEEKNKGPYLTYKKNTVTFSDLLDYNANICSSVIVWKNVLEDVSFFPEEKKFKAIEDYALWLRLSTKINFSYIEEPLVNYYDSPVSSVRANYTDYNELREVIFSDLLSWLEKNNISVAKENKIKIEKLYKESLKRGKRSLLDKVKNKLKIKK